MYGMMILAQQNARTKYSSRKNKSSAIAIRFGGIFELDKGDIWTAPLGNSPSA